MHRTECNHFISLNNSCFALGGEGVLAVDYEHLVKDVKLVQHLVSINNYYKEFSLLLVL